MPRAVVDVTPQRCELKSCPGGFVMLRRMPYDKWLHRTDISMQMQLEMAQRGQGRKNRAHQGGGAQKMDMKLQNQAVTLYEFQNCIVEHNLEDAEGNLLDFGSPRSLAVLDPQIGNEIGELINDLHEPISEVEEGNS